MKISKEQIKKMDTSFSQAEVQKVAQKAVTNKGILAASEDVEVLKRLSPPNFAFSIDVDKEAVANQQMSGRCWMFACMNTLRFHIEKELNLPKGTFELSQAYLAFYAKLERCAWFLQHIIDTAGKRLDDREVDWLISTPMSDGGDWDMICGLVKKYGVIPHSAMSETYCTNNTAELNTLLNTILRQDAIKLRKMVKNKKDATAINEVVEEMLNECYRVLRVCFGNPPEKFDFTYEDAKGKYHAVRGITPLNFYKKYCPINLDDYIGVINVPGKDKPYNTMYTIADSDMIPERENLYMNIEMPELKALVIKQLKAGLPVWFGCDVLQHCDRVKGVMAKELFDWEAMFGVKFTMDKAERYEMHDSLPTHAMMIAGVDLDAKGNPLKWKIENTWGTSHGGNPEGNNGYFVCTDEWFDNFVYEVAIDKQFMTVAQKKILKTEPIEWPYWTTFNPVMAARY